MKKILIKSFVCALLAIALPCGALALDKTGAPGSTEGAAATEKKAMQAGTKLPYRGKVSAVDPTGKTFTIKGKEKDRVFSITEGTKITRNGEPADMGAIAAGEEVRGQAVKSGDAWEAASVMVGPKAESTNGKKTAKPGETKADMKK